MAEFIKRTRRAEKEKSEYDQKVLDVGRVTRVVAGGRRFRFRLVVAIGNRMGKIGIGVAKAQDVTTGVEKAVNNAKKNLIVVPIKDATIPHEVFAKFGAAKVLLKPAKKGKGLVAGSVVRIICELVGIENISSKVVSRSTNKLNNAKATIEALKKLRA
ncbi:MAG: 30S ribosomal protein S5 [bacterium]